MRLQLLIDDNVVDAAGITPHHPGTWVTLVEEDAVGINLEQQSCTLLQTRTPDELRVAEQPMPRLVIGAKTLGLGNPPFQRLSTLPPACTPQYAQCR